MYSTFRPLAPLSWGQAETPADKRRSRWTFKAHYDDTVNLLDREIEALGADSFVIEADFLDRDIKRDGMPRANARQPQFPGVRVSFDSKHGPLQYQTDSCIFWQHNLRSIALGLEALRAVDRYGITSRAEQYTGFKAIGGSSAPAIATPSMLRSTAIDVIYRLARLDAGEPLTKAMKRAKYYAHTDTGGDESDWIALQEALLVVGEA